MLVAVYVSAGGDYVVLTVLVWHAGLLTRVCLPLLPSLPEPLSLLPPHRPLPIPLNPGLLLFDRRLWRASLISLF